MTTTYEIAKAELLRAEKAYDNAVNDWEKAFIANHNKIVIANNAHKELIKARKEERMSTWAAEEAEKVKDTADADQITAYKKAALDVYVTLKVAERVWDAEFKNSKKAENMLNTEKTKVSELWNDLKKARSKVLELENESKKALEMKMKKHLQAEKYKVKELEDLMKKEKELEDARRNKEKELEGIPTTKTCGKWISKMCGIWMLMRCNNKANFKKEKLM